MRIYQGTPGTSDAVLVVPTIFGTRLAVTLANITASTATVRLHLYPDGDSANDSNILVPDVSVPGYSIVALEVPISMRQGDVISGEQGTADAINVFLDVQ